MQGLRTDGRTTADLKQAEACEGRRDGGDLGSDLTDDLAAAGIFGDELVRAGWILRHGVDVVRGIEWVSEASSGQ